MTFDQNLAEELIALKKTLAPAGWVHDPNSISLNCDYDGPHPMIGRLKLIVRISSGSTDKISFTLLLRKPGFKQSQRIYALDLNPTGPHCNPFKPRDIDSGRMFRPGQSHEHHFKDRTDDADPSGFARDIAAKLHGFDDTAAYVCDRLNTCRPPDFPPPPSQGQLL